MRHSFFSRPFILLFVLALTSPSASARNPIALRLLDKVQGALPVGAGKCTECHDAQGNFFIGKKHEKPYLKGSATGCESCHGPGSKHVESASPDEIVNKADLAKISALEKSNMCLQCHQDNLADTRNWPLSTHASADISCWDCHREQLHFAATAPAVPQEPGYRKREIGNEKAHIADPFVRSKSEICFTCHEDQRFQFLLQFRHPIERNRMSCTDCHNPHGETEKVSMVSLGRDQPCVKCHAEQRGPFVWQHGAMEDGCTTCHAPHGSINDKLLVQNGNGLCLQCHYESQFPDFGSVSAHRFRLDRHARCFDCHTRVHGSNVSKDLTQ